MEVMAQLNEKLNEDSTQLSCHAVTINTCLLAKNLSRGINFGNMLEAPLEGDYGLRLDPSYISKVSSTFATARLPVRWSNHAAPTEDAALDDFFAARVDSVIDDMLKKGLYVILNMHHYRQIFGDKLQSNEFGVDPSIVNSRFINIWRQISYRYKNKSPKLIFELLNEPHGSMDGEAWNKLLSDTLTAVRESNPNRAVIIGPGNWNNPYDLPKLKIPKDENLIIAIHNYKPMEFTHQGADWISPRLPVGVTCCNQAQRSSILSSLEYAANWSRHSGYPLHLGEFGSLQTADMQSRENYTRFVRDEAEQRGIGWAYWEFASTFGVYSPKTGLWVEPIRRALLD